MKVLARLGDADTHIRAREPFRSRARSIPNGYYEWVGSSFSGRPGRDDYLAGALPGIYLASLWTADFVVMSYKTPIAWFATRPHDTDLDVTHFLQTGEYGRWIVPDVKYSLTTTNHQSIVRGALWEIGFSTGWGDVDRVPCGGERHGW